MDIDSLINAYAKRFVVRKDAYYQQWANATRYGYKCIDGAVTRQVVRDHLTGQITCGWPAVDANGFSKWCAWDEDNDSGFLDKIAETLTDLGWHPTREGKRPGRAGHLWLFFDSRVQAIDLIRFEREIRVFSSVPQGQSTLEFFPKQPKAARVASCVRGPLGIHRKPGAGNT